MRDLERDADSTARYLKETFNLDSIIIMGSYINGDGEVCSFQTEKGNFYANSEMCRRHTVYTDEWYMGGEIQDNNEEMI